MGKNSNDEVSIPEDVPGYGLGVRHIQVLLVCLWNILCYIMCNILPVCIIAMTDPNKNPDSEIPTFPNWTDQSIVLSSFAWGYTITQLFGGHYGKKHGFKWYMIGIMGIGAIVNLSLPSVTVCFGSIGLIFCYLLQGLAQGFGMPLLPQFINIWVPNGERATLGNAVFASYGIGCILATKIAGVLSSSRWGWPSVFYFAGFLGLVWIVLMLMLGVNRPEEHKRITNEELLYINYQKIEKEIPFPWRKVFTSRAVWATWILQIGAEYLYWLLYIEFPTYINKSFRFSVKVDSQILTIAYLISWLVSLAASAMVDYLNNRRILKTGVLRIICASVATYGPAIGLIWLSFLDYTSPHLAVFLIMMIFLTMSTVSCGYPINYNDISPNHCGSLFGIGGFLSCAASLLAVGLTELAVTDQDDSKQWAIVIWFCCFMAIITNIYYTIYGSAEVQEWDHEIEDENERKPILMPSLTKH